MRSSKTESRAVFATQVKVTSNTLSIDRSDGRSIAVPTHWYPRLVHATKAERASWRLIGGGSGIHWPDIDEDISVLNLLVGQPSNESPNSLKDWLTARQKTPRSKTRQSKSNRG